jgi:hypothetical protein
VAELPGQGSEQVEGGAPIRRADIEDDRSFARIPPSEEPAGVRLAPGKRRLEADVPPRFRRFSPENSRITYFMA